MCFIQSFILERYLNNIFLWIYYLKTLAYIIIKLIELKVQMKRLILVKIYEDINTLISSLGCIHINETSSLFYYKNRLDMILIFYVNMNTP